MKDTGRLGSNADVTLSRLCGCWRAAEYERSVPGVEQKNYRKLKAIILKVFVRSCCSIKRFD